MAQQIAGYNIENAVGYHYGRFPPRRMDYELLINPLQRAATAIARYDAMLGVLHNKNLLLGPLRSQEAVVSSRIEGTVTTLDEILEADANDGARPKAQRQEVQEVRSYIRALGHAQRMLEVGLPISGRVIREAHGRMLFTGRGAGKTPGKFKTEQNYVADQITKEILFVPISPGKLEEGFKKFEQYVNDESQNPLLMAALAHAEFEALHPFKDGNGRIGRMLITLSLWTTGLISGPYFYISSQLEANREEYIHRLRAVSSEDAWTQWCVFFLNALAAQAKENIDTASRIADLYEEMKEAFRYVLSSQRYIHVLDFVFEKPVFTNSLLTEKTGIHRATAAKFTKILASQEFLRIALPASGQTPAVYAFDPLLDIVRG